MTRHPVKSKPVQTESEGKDSRPEMEAQKEIGGFEPRKRRSQW